MEVVFARILTVTGGKPITQAISALFSFRTDWGLVMAMTVFSLLPGVLMIYLVRNHIARGFDIVGDTRSIADEGRFKFTHRPPDKVSRGSGNNGFVAHAWGGDQNGNVVRFRFPGKSFVENRNFPRQAHPQAW